MITVCRQHDPRPRWDLVLISTLDADGTERIILLQVWRSGVIRNSIGSLDKDM